MPRNEGIVISLYSLVSLSLFPYICLDISVTWTFEELHFCFVYFDLYRNNYMFEYQNTQSNNSSRAPSHDWSLANLRTKHIYKRSPLYTFTHSHIYTHTHTRARKCTHVNRSIHTRRSVMRDFSKTLLHCWCSVWLVKKVLECFYIYIRSYTYMCVRIYIYIYI